MAAEGFSIGVGAFLGSSATAYFRKYKRLAPNNLAVSRVTSLGGAASFETLITAVRNSRETEFLLYAHGHPDGSGLYLPLATRRGAATGQQVTVNVLNALIRVGESDKPAADRDLNFLGIAKDEANRLAGLMTDLRAKKITTIEFRGCNLGRNTGSMQSFKKFFGAQTFGAPDLYSFFGSSTVNIGAKYVAEHRDHRPPGTWYEYPYPFQNPAGTLVNNIAVDSMKPASGYAVADSIDTVRRWIKGYIDADGSYETSEGSALLHGLWDTGKRAVDTKSIRDAPIGSDLKLPDPTMFLPLEADFKKHVIYL